MKRPLVILFMCAALLSGEAALASPGEANVTVTDTGPSAPAQDAAIGNMTGKADVIVSDGQLSVSAQEATIGNILSEISLKAGFELDVNPEVSQKIVTTKFKDLDIQKGIERLFALIRHKDYFIYYGPDGGISRLEVHGANDNASPAMKRSRTPASPIINNNRRRMPPRQRIRQSPPVPNNMNSPSSQQPHMPGRTNGTRRGVAQPVNPMPVNPMPVNPQNRYSPASPGYPDKDVPDDMMVPPPPSQPDGRGSMPYIPPARMPAYIPPKH